MEKHSVALNGTQWHSVALSGSHLLLARHACLLLRLRLRLRLLHTQRLGGLRGLLGRPRTLQPHGLVALPCLRARGAIKCIRGNQVQLGAIKGTRSQSGQSVLIRGHQGGCPCLLGLALGFPRLNLRLQLLLACLWGQGGREGGAPW